MKKRISNFVLLCFFLLLFGCGSLPVAQQSGKEDVAYLLFVTQGQYRRQNVSVVIDGTEFVATPVKASKSQTKGKIYSASTGNRLIEVKNNKGEVIYKKRLFLSTQETKQIILP